MLAGAGSVTNASGHQQYPPRQIYNQQQTITTPYIPPYRPTPPTASNLGSAYRHAEQQDHSAGKHSR